jgi:hypothetical protein
LDGSIDDLDLEEAEVQFDEIAVDGFLEKFGEGGDLEGNSKEVLEVG